MQRRDVLKSVFLPVVAQAAPAGSPPANLRLLGQDRYFAKPGKAEEVYRWRLHACDVAETLGAPRGVVFRGAGGNEPDVIWQVEFPDRESARRAHRRVMDAPEFKAVQAHMGTLIRRYEGSLYQEVIPTAAQDNA